MQSLNPAILYLVDHLPKQTHTHFSSVLNLAIKSQFAVAVIQLWLFIFVYVKGCRVAIAVLQLKHCPLFIFTQHHRMQQRSLLRLSSYTF